MNRNDFQNLARIRMKEAKCLLANSKFDGAYYICGYIIECGLKACIAKKTKKYDFPDKRIANESHKHDPYSLVRTAELGPELDKKIKKFPEFAINWAIVKDWNEKSRYEKHTKKEAEDFYSAVISKTDGVFEWIKQHW